MPIIMLSSLLRGTTWETIQYYLLMFLVLCISLSVHEASHGWAAYKLGDDTAYLQGRLTLNPRAHLDPIGTILLAGGPVRHLRPLCRIQLRCIISSLADRSLLFCRWCRRLVLHHRNGGPVD